MSQQVEGERLRIFAVAADQDTLDLVQAALGPVGDDIELFSDVSSSIARVQQSPPDVVFVDVSMTQRAGLALVHHVRAAAADAEIYAMARPEALEDAARAISLGATGIIVAPPSGDEVLNAATTARGRRAALRQRARLKGENRDLKRALGYVGRLAYLADQVEGEGMAAAIAEVFREASGAPTVALFLPTMEGSSELRCSARLGLAHDAPSFTDEMGLMRFAKETSLEVVPLLVGQLSMGHVLVGGARWNEGPLRQIIHVLAAQATTTLMLAAERERTGRGTIKDAATSAYTFAYFVDIAGREIDKAHRHNRRFALATISIDEASAIPTDDAPPSRAVDVVELVLEAVRDSDVLARVDEREFYLLLPETGGFGAHSCRRRVMALGTSGSKLAGVSMGVATYPHDGGDLLKLLRMAKRRAEASRSSVVHLLRLYKMTLPELTDALLWDVNIAQGKLQLLPEMPRALELPMVDVLGLISAVLGQATRGGNVSVVVSRREGLGFAAGVKSYPGSSREGVQVQVVDVRHRDGCEGLEALAVVSEHGAYALLGRVEHGRFHGLHAADPIFADLIVQRLSELAGVRLME
jgi:PleD family two-component response regulator